MTDFDMALVVAQRIAVRLKGKHPADDLALARVIFDALASSTEAERDAWVAVQATPEFRQIALPLIVGSIRGETMN